MHTCSLCNKCEKGPCEWKFFCSNRGKLLKHFKPLSHNTQKAIQNKDSTKPFLAFCRLFLFYPNNHLWVLQNGYPYVLPTLFRESLKQFVLSVSHFFTVHPVKHGGGSLKSTRVPWFKREWKKMETSMVSFFCKWMDKAVLYHQRIVACALEENIRGVSFL